MSSIGRYGRMWLRVAKQARPDLIKELEQNWDLETVAVSLGESAQREEESLLSAMLQQDPPPDDPPLARVAHHARLRRRAEEIATHHLLETLAEASPDEVS
jgi:hypothetical protein